MKTLVITLAALMLIASTGCGSSSSTPLITYVARPNSSGAPQLFTLTGTTATPTAVQIAIPTNALYVSSNRTATAVTYCYDSQVSGTYDIFLMGTDGTEHELTTGADACESVFSPDGKTIAYVSNQGGNGFSIYTMNVDGSNQAALYAPGSNTAEAFYPEFSPDGKSLVFYVVLEGCNCLAQHHANSRVSGWLQQRHGQARSGIQHSANTQVAPSASGWYVMALTDTTPTLSYATTDWWGPAVFSSDGTKLLLTINGAISSIGIDGTGITALTTNTSTNSFSPMPYGNLILFNQEDDTNSSWDIYVMDQSGNNPTLVVSTANTDDNLIDAYWED
jgi:Tol biopolymer transport system component